MGSIYEEILKIGAKTLPKITEANATVAENWQSGTATSTKAGADLVTYTIAELTAIRSLEVIIGALTAGAQITVRMYHTADGAEEEFYNETFVKGVDPDSLPVIDGDWAESSNLRVEVYSNNAADNGSDVGHHIK